MEKTRLKNSFIKKLKINFVCTFSQEKSIFLDKKQKQKKKTSSIPLAPSTQNFSSEYRYFLLYKMFLYEKINYTLSKKKNLE